MNRRFLTALVLIGYSALLIKVVVFRNRRKGSWNRRKGNGRKGSCVEGLLPKSNEL
jgi:hypothetical protein